MSRFYTHFIHSFFVWKAIIAPPFDQSQSYESMWCWL
uniref:Uncharacterized protein n=1 Tax=Anguilla anguilla TaxID=7936 RepID=A0A0E9WHN6_ANGAN